MMQKKNLLVENHMRKKVVGEKDKKLDRLKEERKSTNLSRKEKNFLCESDWYKEVAAKPKFAIHNVKTRFPFIYASTSLDTKRLTLASNCNFESCMSIRCFAPQHILQFFPFLPRDFSLLLATLLITVSSSLTLHLAIEI